MLFPFILITLFLRFIFASCPNGTIQFYTDPALCFSFHSNKTDYINAEGICINFGGHLASVHSIFENLFLSEKAGSIFTESTSSDFWFGANAVTNPGTWSWMDGTAFDFTDWDKDQPQNTTNTVCGSMEIQGGKWIAEDCYKTKPFVCLIKILSKTTTPSPTIPTTLTTTTVKTTAKTTATSKTPKTCNSGWSYYNEFCYKVFDPASWYNAESMCVIEGGHLASIHDSQEALFVANLAYYNGADVCDGSLQVWVGLYTDDKWQTFKWTDGTSVDYLKWGSHNPSHGEYFYCSIMSIAPICENVTGAFYLDPCTMNTKFVCKK